MARRAIDSALGIALGILERRARFDARVPGQPWANRFKLVLGWYETDSADACRALIRPGMTVVDAGAHVGYYSVLASRLVGPQGLVIAFEPSVVALPVLRRNAARAPWPNVEVVPLALGDAPGTATLTEYTASGWTSLHDLTRSVPGLAVVARASVPVVTLDGYLAGRGDPGVDFVKMDLEGSEPAALRGMRRTILANPRLTLLIELNSATLRAIGVTPADLIGELEKAGFAVFAIDGRRRVPAAELRARDWGLRGHANLLCLPRLGSAGR